jgi:hypothetical protein
MTNNTNQTSLRSAALVAGLAILTMVISAPFAELYVYPKLVVPGMAAETANNIIGHKTIFISGMFGYLITFICDLLVSWALYILLRPVNKNLSLLTALFRLVYAMIAIVALLNLFMVFRLLNNPDFLKVFTQDQLYAQVMLSLNTFRYGFYFGIIFFSIHLGLLGYLVFRSKYIPRIMGVLLIISGSGYLMTSLKPYLFPNINLDFALYTYYGELIFMLWLLIKGPRIPDIN